MEDSINQRIVCQSCGMPMKVDKDFGSEIDGSKSKDFCCFCYEFGEFKDEGISLQDKINSLVSISVEQLGLNEETARKMAETKIPQLKRWKKDSE